MSYPRCSNPKCKSGYPSEELIFSALSNGIPLACPCGGAIPTTTLTRYVRSALAQARVDKTNADKRCDSATLAAEHLRIEEFVRSTVGSGKPKRTTCRACNELINVVPRPLHSGQARWMIALHHLMPLSPDGFVDQMKTFDMIGVKNEKTRQTRSRDYSYLRFWGFVEMRPETDEEASARGQRKGRTSYWKLTAKGADFVTRHLSVPPKAFIYRNKLLGFVDGKKKLVGILEVLKGKFDYYDLMRLPRPEETP